MCPCRSDLEQFTRIQCCGQFQIRKQAADPAIVAMAAGTVGDRLAALLRGQAVVAFLVGGSVLGSGANACISPTTSCAGSLDAFS